MSDEERRNFSDEEGEDVGFDDSDRDDSEEEEEDDEEEIKRVRTNPCYGCDTLYLLSSCCRDQKGSCRLKLFN